MPLDKNAQVVLSSDTPQAERQNLAFAGTTISGGYGRGVVIATGMTTELGRIAGRVIEAKQPYTPLQVALRRLALWLSLVACALSIPNSSVWMVVWTTMERNDPDRSDVGVRNNSRRIANYHHHASRVGSISIKPARGHRQTPPRHRNARHRIHNCNG